MTGHHSEPSPVVRGEPDGEDVPDHDTPLVPQPASPHTEDIGTTTSSTITKKNNQKDKGPRFQTLRGFLAVYIYRPDLGRKVSGKDDGIRLDHPS